MNQDKNIQTSRTKIMESIEKAQQQQYVVFSDFLDMQEGSFVLNLIQNRHFPVLLDGGYDEAERKMMVALPYRGYEYYESSDLPIVYLLIEPLRKNSTLSHRDYLGALMNLGINRNTMGDLVMIDDGCVVIVTERMRDYIQDNLTMVARESVSVTIYQNGRNLGDHKSFEEIRGTVASLRLDNIVKLCTNFSRDKAVKAIESGLVFVDGQQILKNSRLIEVENIITIRGKGKFRITKIGDRTRKDRIFVEVDRYN